MQLANQLDLRQYIAEFRGLLSQSTCDEIIEWSRTLPDSTDAWSGWATAESALTNTQNAVTNTRICEFTMLDQQHGPCWHNIQTALKHIIQQYPYYHKATEHTGVQLIRYGAGNKFEEHIDHYGGANRTLSCSMILNQDYEGGALRFWQGQYQVPDLRTGDAVVFPSNFCYPHEITPVTSGTRYVLIVWFS